MIYYYLRTTCVNVSPRDELRCNEARMMSAGGDQEILQSQEEEEDEDEGEEE